MSGRSLSWLRIKAVARRHAYVLRRGPHRLFDVTVWPVVDVLLFGSIGAFVSTQPGVGHTAYGYLLTGIVLWHVVYQSQIALSTGVLEETWSRHILSLMVTPMTEFEYAAGVALFGLVKLALGVGLVALVAALAFAFNITTLGWGLLPIVAILLVTGWVISLFVIGCMFRFGNGAEALTWGVLFAVLPLSGVFYPISALPAVVRPIALVLPTTHAFDAGRGLVDGRGMQWDQITIAALSTAAFGLLAIGFLARMMKVFRQRGYISRYT
ncbi:MAG: type transport system permease protein [Actinomycetota bacterium]|nr:type transport system permease protein [Actinomycetota bacterium]